MSSIIDAAYHVVHDHPGGAMSLAPRLSPRKSWGQLCQEVNPRPDGMAKLGILTARDLTALTGNDAIVHAFTLECGGMFVRPASSHASAPDAMAAVAGLAKEFGELTALVSGAVADGTVSLNELKRVEKEAMDLLQQVAQVLTTVRAMHEARG